MASMSDFHVVGDPRYAPDAPGGGGGVSKEYVDNADTEVKKTSAKGHNTKYDETVIPSQYANKLYVYNDPESMYKASEQEESGEGFFESGNVVIHYHNDWNWGDVSNTTYRRYDDAYKGLAIVKTTPPYATEAQILDKFYVYRIVAGDGTQLVIADNNVLASVNEWSLSHSTVERDDGYTQEMFNFSAYDAIPTHSLPYPQAPDFWNGILFVSAMLPVFDLDTQAGVDAFNTYQTTGDYSGAINYSDLNPLSPDSFVAIDVISGDWYKVVNSAWVKQGTLDLNETGGTEVEANPQGTPTDTLNSIGIDGVIYGIEGGGGSGSGSEIIPITAGDGTTSRTFQLSKTPSMIVMSYFEGNDDSGWSSQYVLIWGSARAYGIGTGTPTSTSGESKTVGVTYGADGKSFTINAANAGSALNTNTGHGYLLCFYDGGSVGGASSLSDLTDVDLTNLSDGQILQYNSTTEKWENTDNQGSLPFEFVIDSTDNGINIVYDDGGE